MSEELKAFIDATSERANATRVAWGDMADCHFCGAKADEYHISIGYNYSPSDMTARFMGECDECGAMGPVCDTPEESLSRWNAASRTPTEAEPGEAEVVIRSKGPNDPAMRICGKLAESGVVVPIATMQAALAALRSTPNAVDGQQWYCLRCRQPVAGSEDLGEFVAGKCGCTSSPSPWAPVYRCTICAAGWVRHNDNTWSLISENCGPCCDNARMGEQIQPTPAVAVDDDAEWLRDGLPLTAGVTEEDQQRIDAIADRLQSLLVSVRVKDEALRPFAAERLSTEPTVSDCLHRSPGALLRMQADSVEKRDANIRKARAALSDQQGGE